MTRRRAGLVALVLAVLLLPAAAAGAPQIVDVVEHDTTTKGPGSVEVVLNETVVAADDGGKLATEDVVFTQPFSQPIDDVGDPGAGDVYRIANVTGDSSIQRRVVVSLERYNRTSGSWEPYRVPPTAGLEMNLSAVESTATGTVVDPPPRAVRVTSWDLNRSDLSRDTPGTALPVKRESLLALDAEDQGFTVTVFDDTNNSVVFGPRNTGDAHAAVLDTSGLETGGRTYRVQYENTSGVTVATRYFNVSTLDISVSPNSGPFYLGEHTPIAGLVQTDRTGRTGETVSGRLDDNGGVPVRPSVNVTQRVDASGFRNVTLIDPVTIPREPITGTYTVRAVDDLTGRTAATDVTVACGRISSPTVVDDRGCYVVTQSATDSTATTYLQVSASNVTVRGQGFTIDGVGTSGTAAIEVGSGNDRVAIRNLTVQQFGFGAVAVNASRVAFRNVAATDNTDAGFLTQLGDRVRIEGGLVAGNGDGILVQETPRVTVAGTTVESNLGAGVRVGNAGPVTLTGGSVSGNAGDGLSAVDTRDLGLEGTDLSGNAGAGIRFTNVSDARVSQVVASTNGDTGLVVNTSEGTVIADSTLRDNGRYGISVGGLDAGSHDTHAETLDARGNALGAIRIEGPDFDPSSNTTLGAVDLGSSIVDVRGRYVRVNTSLSPPAPPADRYETDTYASVETIAGVPSQAALRFAYTDGDIAGLTESSLGTLQYRSGTWNETASTLNASGNRITTDTSADGDVGVFASERFTAPELTLSTTSIPFGETIVGNTVTETVTATNTGNATMALDPPTLAGATAAFDVQGSATTLDPGASTTITAAFSPRGSGDVGATMTVPTNASDGRVTLEGTGVVASAAIDPTAIDFGTRLLGDAGEERVTLTNTGEFDLTLEGAEVTGAGADAYASDGTLPATLAPGDLANLTIRFHPATTGSKPGTLTVGIGADGVGPLTVDLAGRAVNRSVAVSTTGLTFGDVPPGATETARLEVTNDGATAVELAGTIVGDVNDTFATDPAGPLALDPGATRTLTVSYAPRDRGTDTASLALTDTDGIRHATVSLRGEARAGSLSVTPRSLSFANATVGATARRTVRVHNGGNAPLTIAATRLVGPDAYGLSTGGTFSLAPGQERTLTVSYTPTDTAADAGLLRVITAEDRLSNATVYLTNTATSAAVTVQERPDQTRTGVTVVNATAGEPVTTPVVDDRAGRNLSVSNISLVPTVSTTFRVDIASSGEPLPSTRRFQLGDGTTPLGYLSIDHNLSNENIASVRFRYRVPTDTLSALDTDAGAVSLYRDEAGDWVPKTTTVRGVTGGVAYLETTADGLSEWTAAARRPRFNVSDTDTSIDSGIVGDEASIQVFVLNTGGAEGVYVAKLLLNGEVVDRREATIPDGGKRALNFRRSFDDPGTYQIRVNDVFVGEVEISAANESVAVDTDSTPAADGADGDEDPTTDEAGDGGGLPVLPLVLVAALVVLGLGAWLAIGRREPAAQDGPVETGETTSDGPVVTEAGSEDDGSTQGRD